jgi:AbrB family looped-hinge helix DNA binding protein
VASATLSTKGQVVIPRALRESLGLVAGTKFDVRSEHGVLVLRPLSPLRTTTLDEIVAVLKYDGPRKSLEEMDAGIAAGARASR